MSHAPYSQEISRQNKACFLFLLDQSFSMEEPLGTSTNRKCDELVTAINGWLQNMAIRASGDEGIKDWMDVGVLRLPHRPQRQPDHRVGLAGPAGRPDAGLDHRDRRQPGPHRHPQRSSSPTKRPAR